LTPLKTSAWGRGCELPENPEVDVPELADPKEDADELEAPDEGAAVCRDPQRPQ
jgi:hypothetical protein